MSTATRSQAAGAGADAPTPASPRSHQHAVPLRKFDPEIHCGVRLRPPPDPGHLTPDALEARLARVGQPCQQRKGFRTDHPGFGHCWLHYGTTPSGRIHAARDYAQHELAAMAVPSAVEPIESLLEAVRVASWRESGLRLLLQRRFTLLGPDHAGDDREDVVSRMHAAALKQKADIASLALERGLDQRMVEMAERQADIVVLAVQAALDSAGVEGEVRAKAEAAAADVMDPVAPVGAGLN